MNRRKYLAPLALLLLVSVAWGRDDTPSANSLALGGTAAALPGDNASIGVNPGALGLEERYDVHGLAQWTPARGYLLGASIVDSRGGAFAMGLSYVRTLTEPPYSDADLPGWVTEEGLPPNYKRWHEVGFAAALPLLDRRLSLGLGGVLGMAEHDRGGKATLGNVDLGIAGEPTPGLTLGLVGRNLLPLADAAGDYPVGLLGGARYRSEGLGAVSVDLGAVLEGEASPWQLSAGVEAEAGTVRPRLGYRVDRGVSSLSWGLGSENESGSLDYAMIIPLRSDLRFDEVVHALSVRLFL